MPNARNRVLTAGAALACCAGVAAPALAGSGRARPTDAHNHRAAVRNAVRLLQRAPLPAGATRSPQEPSGDGGVLGRPPFTQGVGKLVDRHRWWTVNEPLDTVLDYVKSDSPAGGSLDTTCAGGGNGPQWRCVGFAFAPRPGVLGTRALAVEMVDLGNGTTGVRADAEVQWIITRPASERVPPGVGEIEVTRNGPNRGEAVAVGDPTTIRKIVRLFDALPVLQPGSWHCPGIPSNAATVTIAFKSAGRGPTLARASVRADVGASQTGCDAMSFWIGQKRQMPLVGARRFLSRLGDLVGTRLTQRPR